MNALTDYSSKAMLVKLTRRTWGTTKNDPTVAKAILAQYGASDDSGIFKKRIIAKESLADINTCMNEAYKIHNSMTLPWDDNGRRILSSKNFFEYKRRMNEVESRLAVAVKEFTINYPKYVEEARSKLNSVMFNPLDYPDVDQIASIFKLEIEPEPVPTGNNLHIEIADEYLKTQREEIERRVLAKFTDAHRELYDRLKELVIHLRDSVVGGKEFKAVSVEKVIDLCKQIPSLMIADDSNLSKVAEDIASELSRFNPKDIKNNQRINNRIGNALENQLADLEQSMSAYFTE